MKERKERQTNHVLEVPAEHSVLDLVFLIIQTNERKLHLDFVTIERIKTEIHRV
jgi:hypothetical protein